MEYIIKDKRFLFIGYSDYFAFIRVKDHEPLALP